MTTAKEFLVEELFKAQQKGHKIENIVLNQKFFEMLKKESSFPHRFPEKGEFFSKDYCVDKINSSFELYSKKWLISSHNFEE